jgi:hypothetical protein
MYAYIIFLFIVLPSQHNKYQISFTFIMYNEFMLSLKIIQTFERYDRQASLTSFACAKSYSELGA